MAAAVQLHVRNALVALVVMAMVAGIAAQAHSPQMDGDLSDWCFAAFSNTLQGGGRIENSAAQLVCGNCSTDTDESCELDSDCPTGQTCVDTASRVERIWWDDRTDAAVNDLATLAITQDATNLYVGLHFWLFPDPVALPFIEIGIDWTAGGIDTWHDPQNRLTNPGTCSVSTDRGCTRDEDCHFCAISTEPAPSTRPATCGSGCNPDLPQDVCDTSQVCVGWGSGGAKRNVGSFSNPASLPDHLLVLDLGRWLFGAPGPVLLMEDLGGTWSAVNSYDIVIPPGTGQPGGPPGAIELAIPWNDLGGFVPGADFRFSALVARGEFTLDHTPGGAIEDVMSEAVAGATTTTPDSCPGSGLGTTLCEIDDDSSDAFVHAPCPLTAHPLFPEPMLAHDKLAFSWTSPIDVIWARGSLADVALYAPLEVNSAPGATTLPIPALLPPPGSGHYFLLRPDCPLGSWSSGGTGNANPPGRAHPAAETPASPRVSKQLGSSLGMGLR